MAFQRTYVRYLYPRRLSALWTRLGARQYRLPTQAVCLRLWMVVHVVIPTLFLQSCGSHVRPLAGPGTWKSFAAPEVNDMFHYHTAAAYPQRCQTKTLSSLVYENKPHKYFRAPANARADTPFTSRLVWTDGNDMPQRPFDTSAFLSRFSNSRVVLVGDSLAGVLFHALSVLAACGDPTRDSLWLKNHSHLHVPEYNISIMNVGTRYLTPFTEKRRSAASPSFYIKDGKRMPMKAQEKTQEVSLDVPGLAPWADASLFRDASLVILKQGAWTQAYRSDVVIKKRGGGVLGENSSQTDFAETVFKTGVDRAMAWFDQVLPPTAVVSWVGEVSLAKSCDDVRSDDACKGTRGRLGAMDTQVFEALRRREKTCPADKAACMRIRPRQWLVDVNSASRCRPDFQDGCMRGKVKGGVGNHPVFPGLPDLWAALVLDSILEDDVRCAVPSQLRRGVHPGVVSAATDREKALHEKSRSWFSFRG